MSNHATPRPELGALTSTRFLAAMVVVFFHFSEKLTGPFPGLGFIFSFGQPIISYFFILSGFVLTYNYRDRFREAIGKADYVGFVRARMSRAYPLHLLVMVAFLALQLVILPGFVLNHPWRLAGWLLDASLFQTVIPFRHAVMDWNVPTWSVSCELVFCFFFPSMVKYLARRVTGDRQALAWLAGLWLGGTALSLAIYLVANVVVNGQLSFHVEGQALVCYMYSPLARCSEFAFGTALCCWFLAAQEQPDAFPIYRAIVGTATRRTLWVIGAFAAIVAVCNLPLPRGPMLDLAWLLKHYSVAVPMWGFVLLGLAAGTSLPAWLLDRRWLRQLGDASFAIYMIHSLPVFYLSVVKPTGSFTAIWLHGLAYIAGVVVAAQLLEAHFVEPARRLLRGRRKPAPVVPLEELAA